MSHVSVQTRLRPVRFAFLVRPDNAMQALQAFRVNTCLWGGKYKPIVPFFEEVPKWWDCKGHKFDTAAQIVNGYLDFFEPDFIVEAEPGLSAGIEFDAERVLPLSGVLTREGDRDRNGRGLNILSFLSVLETARLPLFSTGRPI